MWPLGPGAKNLAMPLFIQFYVLLKISKVVYARLQVQDGGEVEKMLKETVHGLFAGMFLINLPR
jgi:hypothetical protein